MLRPSVAPGRYQYARRRPSTSAMGSGENTLSPAAWYKQGLPGVKVWPAPGSSPSPEELCGKQDQTAAISMKRFRTARSYVLRRHDKRVKGKVMLRKTMVALAIAFALGGFALSTRAFALGSAFGGGCIAGDGYGYHSDRVRSLQGGLLHSPTDAATSGIRGVTGAPTTARCFELRMGPPVDRSPAARGRSRPKEHLQCYVRP